MLKEYIPDEKCKAEIRDVQQGLDNETYTDVAINILACITIFIAVPIVVK